MHLKLFINRIHHCTGECLPKHYNLGYLRVCVCVCMCVFICVNGLLIHNCKIGYIIYDQLILVEFVDL